MYRAVGAAPAFALPRTECGPARTSRIQRRPAIVEGPALQGLNYRESPVTAMNFNSFAAAVLVVGISTMVISKVGDIFVPEEHFSHKAEAAHTPGTGAPATKAPADPAVAVVLASADAAKGEKLVRSKCKSCHTWSKGGRNSVGPNLWGVVGREKATVGGFSYSSAMKEAGGNWSFEEIYTFLKRPSAKIKGTKMTYRLRKFGQRADVIAFLRTRSDKPLPLPKAGDPAKKAE